VTSENLTELQLAVMRALWKLGEGTVAEVLAELAEERRVLAPTTVATLLQRLSKQGWVEHNKQGRQFSYRAKVAQKDAASSALRRVMRAFFGGKASALTAQLLETEGISKQDLNEMRKLLAERKQ
jgi:BlaI family transcriptional regulator, penicillinase repressor